jgi:GNAT superfamily N-acetyltransferase
MKSSKNRLPLLEEISSGLEKELEDKYNITLFISERNGILTLSQIVVPKEDRGKGIGHKVMNEITDYADKNNLIIALPPDTTYGATSVSRLKEFYKEFDFIENKGKNKNFEISETMYRLPQ